MSNELGEYIRKKRNQKGYTLNKLAEFSDISPAYLSLVERGKRHPSAKIIARLAKPLDVPKEKLMELAGYIDENDRKESSLYNETAENENVFFFNLEGLSEDEIEIVRNQIEFLRSRAIKRAKQKQKNNDKRNG